MGADTDEDSRICEGEITQLLHVHPCRQLLQACTAHIRDQCISWCTKKRHCLELT